MRTSKKTATPNTPSVLTIKKSNGTTRLSEEELKLLSKLTPEQESVLEEYKKECLQIGINSSRSDYDTVVALMQKMATENTVECPPVVLVKSHYAGTTFLALFRDTEELVGKPGSAKLAKLTNPYTLKDEKFKFYLWESIMSYLNDTTHGAQKEAMFKKLAQKNYINKKSLAEFSTNFLGAYDIFAIAYYRFCDWLGLNYDKESLYRLKLLEDISDAMLIQWYFKEVFVVCEKPLQTCLITSGTDDILSNETGPAIEFEDGDAIYIIDNIRLPEKVVMAPETQTISEIDKEDNAEIRRIRIQRFGPEKYFKESGAKVIDSDRVVIDITQKNTMPRALIVDSQNQKWLIGTDGSTMRPYSMPVFQNVTTCKAAHESICGLNEADCISQS